MITEDYVSFETAKLLKEKGFKIPYDSFRGVYINGIFKRLNPGDAYGYNLGDEIVEVCSVQTAMKWLRDVHDLIISVSFTVHGWLCDITKVFRDSNGFIVNINHGIGDDSLPYCDEHEESCETAIKYCLENLI